MGLWGWMKPNYKCDELLQKSNWGVRWIRFYSLRYDINLKCVLFLQSLVFGEERPVQVLMCAWNTSYIYIWYFIKCNVIPSANMSTNRIQVRLKKWKWNLEFSHPLTFWHSDVGRSTQTRIMFCYASPGRPPVSFEDDTLSPPSSPLCVL